MLEIQLINPLAENDPSVVTFIRPIKQELLADGTLVECKGRIGQFSRAQIVDLHAKLTEFLA